MRKFILMVGDAFLGEVDVTEGKYPFNSREILRKLGYESKKSYWGMRNVECVRCAGFESRRGYWCNYGAVLQLCIHARKFFEKKGSSRLGKEAERALKKYEAMSSCNNWYWGFDEEDEMSRFDEEGIKMGVLVLKV